MAKKNYFPKDTYLLDEARYRKYVSSVMAVANKRIDRLEKNELTDSPAYQKYITEVGVKFSVKGLSHNELQSLVAKLKNFMESETSTVRGLNNVLKNMAKATGIKYDNMKDLQSKAKGFFELSSKVEQYLRNVEDIASAIGYQKIWEAVNQYVSTEKIDLANADDEIEELSKVVGGLIADHAKGKLIDEKEAEKIGQKMLEDMTEDFKDDLTKSLKGKKGEWWFID